MGITQTENFIDRLKQSDNPFLLCQKEKDYLDVNYQGLPTRKKSYSEYINPPIKYFTMIISDVFNYKRSIIRL